jgi:hypothetical protein
MCARITFPLIQGGEVNILLLPDAKINDEWIYTSAPLYAVVT